MIALTISLVFGGKLIAILRKAQAGESIRDLGLEGQLEKSGTPTMGGIIILGAIVVPVLLVAGLDQHLHSIAAVDHPMDGRHWLCR